MEHFLSLSHVWITEYMPVAPAPYIKVFLYGMYQLKSYKKIDNSLISNALQMLPSEVILAWEYWEKEKVIRKKNVINDLDFEIELPIIKSKEIPTSHSSTCPKYSTKELEIYIKNNTEAQELYSLAEKKLERKLSYPEFGILFGFYDWLRLPLDIIDLLLDFCIKEGYSNMKDFQDMALLWTKNRILTTEKALDFMKNYR